MEEQEKYGFGNEAEALWHKIHALLKVLVGAIISSIPDFVSQDKIADAIESDPDEVEKEWLHEEVIPEERPC